MALNRASLGTLLFVVACVVLLSGSERAEARTYSTSTSFGFFASPDTFLGQVHSNNNRCRRGRLVKVFREAGRNDRLIGRGRASSTGQWEIEREVPTARYYALVPKIRFGPQRRHSCKRYKSSTLTFG